MLVLESQWNAAHCLLGQLSHGNCYGLVVCQAFNSKIIFQIRTPIGIMKHDNTFAAPSHLSTQLFMSESLNTETFSSCLHNWQASTQQFSFLTSYVRKPLWASLFFPLPMPEKSQHDNFSFPFT